MKSQQEAFWGTVRYYVGIGQMFGATAALAVWICLGLVRETVILTAGTLVMSLVSVILWGRRTDNVPFRWIRHREQDRR